MMSNRKKVNGKKLLCKNCKWYFADRGSYGMEIENGRRCLNPAFFGPLDDYGVPLEYARLESKKCGLAGKLWEPLPPRKSRSLLGWLRSKN